jgi:hypothetical protein
VDFVITCPKCRARIDVSKQMTARLEEERSKIGAEERCKAAAEVTEEKVKSVVEKRLKAEIERVRIETEKIYRERLTRKDLQLTESQDKLNSVQSKLQEAEAKISHGSAQTQGIIAERTLFQFLEARLSSSLCEVEKRGQGKKGTDVIIHVS